MNKTKEHILKTSLMLFLQKSYRDVTMKEIVERSGMSKGAFYHYFSSKEKLFKEIANQFFDFGKIDYSFLNDNTLYDFYNSYVDVTSKAMQQMIAALYEKGDNSTAFNFFFILFEAINRFPEFLKLEREIHENDIKAWRKVIAKASENGEIASSSTDDSLAELFMCCIDGLSIQVITTNQLTKYKNELKKMLDCLYDSLKA